MLTKREIVKLNALRRELHRFPAVARQEAGTVARIVAALTALYPESLVDHLGGRGVAAVFDGVSPGPTVLFRCELDALPIEELSRAAHRSTIPGKGHLCGPDGHMTILLALGSLSHPGVRSAAA